MWIVSTRFISDLSTTVFVFVYWVHWPLTGGLWSRCLGSRTRDVTVLIVNRLGSRPSGAVTSLRQSTGVVLAWLCVRIPFRTVHAWWRRSQSQTEFLTTIIWTSMNILALSVITPWFVISSDIFKALNFAEMYNMAILCMIAWSLIVRIYWNIRTLIDVRHN